ncbi:MAG: hypothetical protein J6W37_10385 [Bacteroidales bacterium]|nr:hypothetical protein [Bacteroidales bacterium]
MTAKEIFDRVKKYGNSVETTICYLHKPQGNSCCLDEKYKCSKISQKSVLDFDEITKEFCKNQGISPYSSTDALSYKTDSLLFIEIKGWRQFIKYHSTLTKDSILKQEEKYNLNKKLEDSISVCKKIINPNAFVTDDKIVYVLVIDTEVKQQDARVQLLQNLNILAYDSSSIYITISEITKTHLQQSVKRPIRKIRVFCQNFDKTLNYNII